MDATADVSEIPWLFPHKCKFPWPNELTNSKNSFWRTQPPPPPPPLTAILSTTDLCFQQVTWSVHELIKYMCTWPYNKSLEYWPSLFHEGGWVFMVLASFFFAFLLRFYWPISSHMTTRLDNNAFFLPEQWVISRQKNMLGSAMPQLLRTIKAVGYGE